MRNTGGPRKIHMAGYDGFFECRNCYDGLTVLDCKSPKRTIKNIQELESLVDLLRKGHGLT